MDIKWGVIGCGDIAQRMGLPAILAAERSTLVAVADANADRAARVGERFGARRVYSNAEALLSDGDVDAVYIATPPTSHHGLTLLCAAAGKHVLCEKPMAATGEECSEMSRACSGRGLHLAVAYYRRFYPKVLKMQELLCVGAVGKPVYARIQFTMWYDPPDPSDEKEWRTRSSAGGGGCLIDLGSHRLDILAALLGEPSRVTASLGTTACGYAVEDCAYILSEFAGGARSLATFSWNTRALTDELEIFGTEGRLIATPLDGPALRLENSARSLSWDLPRNELTHLPVVENMVRCLHGEEPLLVPGEEAAKASRWIDAAYESARNGGMVSMSTSAATAFAGPEPAAASPLYSVSPQARRGDEAATAAPARGKAPEPVRVESDAPELSMPVCEQMDDRPMSHCPTMIVLPDGSLQLAWFAGSYETSPDTILMASRLLPGSDHWTEPWKISEWPGHSLGQPLLMLHPAGELWLFFDVIMGVDWKSAQPFVQKSADEGRTWSEPEHIREEPGLMFRGRPIFLPGRIVLPVYAELTWRSRMLVSDDDGRSWRLTEGMSTPQGNIHPSVAALSDGTLVAYMRTGQLGTGVVKRLNTGGKGGVIWRAVSRDGGETWTEPAPTAVRNPNAGIDLFRCRSGNLLLAFNNSDSVRTPLCVALAAEEEQWRWLRTLQEGPLEFSYPSLAQTEDGAIHIAYSYGRRYIQYARFSEDWLRGNEVERL